MIHKELLSEVLGVVITDTKLTNNTLLYASSEQCRSTINIYELAHKCKEWASHLTSNRFAFSSYPRWGNNRDYPVTDGFYYVCEHLVTGAQFEAETEPEAVFKACQWILDNKEK